METKPGDHFIVKVGEREYDTVIDEHNTQRFVGNMAIRLMVDASGRDFDRALRGQGTHPSFTLNTLAIAYDEGKVSLEDMLDFYTGMQYSVGALSTLSYFEQMEFSNPVWDAYDAEQAEKAKQAKKKAKAQKAKKKAKAQKAKMKAKIAES